MAFRALACAGAVPWPLARPPKSILLVRRQPNARIPRPGGGITANPRRWSSDKAAAADAKGRNRTLADGAKKAADTTVDAAGENTGSPSAVSQGTVVGGGKEDVGQKSAVRSESTWSDAASTKSSSTSTSSTSPSGTAPPSQPQDDWEDVAKYNISTFSELPHANFGINQHVPIDQAFKEALRLIPWQFKAPIMYAAAYGSGVFPQQSAGGGPVTATEEQIRAVHPKPPKAVVEAQGGRPKMIDFIFGVTHTQHWHSLNLTQHRDHYSAVGSLGSGAVSWLQDGLGAGVYFHPYVAVNGILIKYGVVNLATLCRDLSAWDTLYLAGRLHKPVKILRDNPAVRLANQSNLLSAVRTALLLLPPRFSELDLYNTIAGISYLGDPRMSFPTENPAKVSNIVRHNFANFRRLYAPLVETLPNVYWADNKAGDGPAAAKSNGRKPPGLAPDWQYLQRAGSADASNPLPLEQDMDPTRRANMVRRLPRAFRARLYLEYQSAFVPGVQGHQEFADMMRRDREEGEEAARAEGGAGAGAGAGAVGVVQRRRVGAELDRAIAQDDQARLRDTVRKVIRDTVRWPSTVQSAKGVVSAGLGRSLRYLGEKMAKSREGKKAGEAEKRE